VSGVRPGPEVGQTDQTCGLSIDEQH
jgi:hypothetical protein